jgi:hypothetical protein
LVAVVDQVTAPRVAPIPVEEPVVVVVVVATYTKPFISQPERMHARWALAALLQPSVKDQH